MTNEEFQRVVLEQFEKLNNRVGNLEETVNTVNSKVGNLEGTVNTVKEQTAELTEFREETRTNFARIENYIHELDTKNSDRHLNFTGELKELRNSINRIEINAAENWRDIARLKSVR